MTPEAKALAEALAWTIDPMEGEMARQFGERMALVREMVRLNALKAANSRGLLNSTLGVLKK